MLSTKEINYWGKSRTAMGREIVLAERRTLYEWRLEDGSGEVITVSLSGGALMCSCGSPNCVHEHVVLTMMGVS